MFTSWLFRQTRSSGEAFGIARSGSISVADHGIDCARRPPCGVEIVRLDASGTTVTE